MTLNSGNISEMLGAMKKGMENGDKRTIIKEKYIRIQGCTKKYGNKKSHWLPNHCSNSKEQYLNNYLLEKSFRQYWMCY